MAVTPKSIKGKRKRNRRWQFSYPRRTNKISKVMAQLPERDPKLFDEII